MCAPGLQYFDMPDLAVFTFAAVLLQVVEPACELPSPEPPADHPAHGQHPGNPRPAQQGGLRPGASRG